MSIQLVKISHGVQQIIIKDCLTEERAKEFLQLCEEDNRLPTTVKYDIVHFSTTLTYEELEKRQRQRKIC